VKTNVTEKLEGWLRGAGVPFRVLEHEPVFTSEEAARVRGTPPEAGAKALVVRADDRHVHVVLPGHLRVDSARLRQILGVRKLRFVTRPWRLGRRLTRIDVLLLTRYGYGINILCSGFSFGPRR